MSSYEHIFRNLQVDKDKAIDFFIVFSRFEYALKKGGYASGDATNIKPNWNEFTTSLNGYFGEYINTQQQDDLREAVDYLMNNPPKKQAYGSGGLIWVDMSISELKLSTLSNIINVVRNNLFHGGKFEDSSEHNPYRNNQLLDKSLIVLKAFLELARIHKPDVARYFFNTKGLC